MTPLPVLATVADSWRELRHDWRLFVRLAAIPLAISIVGKALLVAGGPVAGAGGDVTLAAMLRGLAYAVLLALVSVPAITAWHRHVIVGPATGAAPDPATYRVDAAEWLYVKKLLVAFARLILPYMVIGVPVAVLSWSSEPGAPAGIRGGAFTTLFTAAIYAWLASRAWLLLFPAAALGRPLTAAETRALARGNRLRLAAVIALAYLPVVVVDEFLPALTGSPLDPDSSATMRIAHAALQSVVQYGFLAITVGALSFSYLRLGGPRAPG